MYNKSAHRSILMVSYRMLAAQRRLQQARATARPIAHTEGKKTMQGTLEPIVIAAPHPARVERRVFRHAVGLVIFGVGWAFLRHPPHWRSVVDNCRHG